MKIIQTHNIKVPKQVHTTSLGLPEKFNKEYIKKIYELVGPENFKTNVKGLMTTWWIGQESNIFLPFIKKVEEIVNYINPETKKLIITECWGAIYQKTHYAKEHHHLPNEISFVYFLNDSSTPLIFPDFSIIPKKDLLTFFPSDLLHTVPEHKDQQDRVILSGNLNYSR